MDCYRKGGCRGYEMYSCSECLYSKPPEESRRNAYIDIGLKEIKFCKYCGSKNIVEVNAYYKHHNCLECGTQYID